MTEPRVFNSGVARSTALLPAPPPFWSHSSLKDVESCPRRYVLSRSKFPELWTNSGYPDVPNPASVFGDVVHNSLEVIIRALVDAGCTSASGSQAVSVLKELHGYTAVAQGALDDRLALLDGNPRLSEVRRVRLAQALHDRIPEAREEIQTYLHRMTLTPKLVTAEATGGIAGARHPCGNGSHPEVTLQIDYLRVWGRVDLLTVTDDRVDITDYKTGSEDESHLAQLRFYALLWDQDEIANPDRKTLGTLTASYPTHDLTIDAPDAAELQSSGAETAIRVAAADQAVMSDRPDAHTGDYCAFCSVRVLCSSYWREAPDPAGLEKGTWFDFEGVVGARNGNKSWWLLDTSSSRTSLLLRTSSTNQILQTGTRMRFLGLRRDEDPDVGAPVATMTPNSELFAVSSEGDY